MEPKEIVLVGLGVLLSFVAAPLLKPILSGVGGTKGAGMP